MLRIINEQWVESFSKITCGLVDQKPLYNRLFTAVTQKFVRFGQKKKGNFKCMRILFMSGSTWGVAILL